MDDANPPDPDRRTGDIPAADDRAETARFVRGHVGWMLRVARSYLRDPSLAEDAVQTAFAKIFANAAQYEGRAALQAWMRRIVVNEALMILRKRKTAQDGTSIEKLLPEFDRNGCRLEAPWSQPQDPEKIVITQQTRQFVMDAIESLPEDYRVILLLRDIEEMSTREAAETLNLSESNVKVRLHRARAALKTHLEPHMRRGRLET